VAGGAIDRTQAFQLSDYKDLTDYLTGIEQANLRVDGHTLADVRSAIRQLVISNDSSYEHAYGLSVWLPSTLTEYAAHSQRYGGLVFDKKPVGEISSKWFL